MKKQIYHRFCLDLITEMHFMEPEIVKDEQRSAEARNVERLKDGVRRAIWRREERQES